MRSKFLLSSLRALPLEVLAPPYLLRFRLLAPLPRRTAANALQLQVPLPHSNALQLQVPPRGVFFFSMFSISSLRLLRLEVLRALRLLRLELLRALALPFVFLLHQLSPGSGIKFKI